VVQRVFPVMRVNVVEEWSSIPQNLCGSMFLFFRQVPYPSRWE
jgi:hypothetical protein